MLKLRPQTFSPRTGNSPAAIQGIVDAGRSHAEFMAAKIEAIKYEHLSYAENEIIRMARRAGFDMWYPGDARAKGDAELKGAREWLAKNAKCGGKP